MPNEVWGFEPGDRVEFRRRRVDPWELGVVTNITRERNLMVKADDNPKLYEVRLPTEIRLWRAPRTTDDIEKFLNGG